MGELEVTLRRDQSAEAYRETLLSCLEEVERLTAVVDGLLELSRADTGQIDMDIRHIGFSTLVDEICDDILILADMKHITVVTSVQPDVHVEGDKVRLHQALLNVLENAVKYTPEGGRVEVTMSTGPHQAVVIVSDNGPGIEPEHLPFIFDRFYRVDKARSQRVRGTGLGLAIAKWVVDAHDGSIRVASEPGRGTTFTIMLPLRHGVAPS
jgi:signal transduction histidine kinase